MIFPTNAEFIHLSIHSLWMNAEFNSLAVTLEPLLWLGRLPCFAQLLLYPQSCLDEESARSKGLVSMMFVWTSCCLDLDLIQTMWLKAHD